MMTLPEMVALPLKQDTHGTIYVSGTRITLDTIIGFYRQGESPEDLHEGFPTIPLADIYTVIDYYLANQTELDSYLQQRNEQADAIQTQWEIRNPPPTKATLLARLAASS